MARFVRYELRTTGIAAARAFYEAVLGAPCADASPLPEAVLARGGRPHWLGHVGVEDVEQTARAWVDRGAARLGPTRSTPSGGDVAILRDAGGAIVALTSALDARPANALEVVGHSLNTADLARAVDVYTSLFGWSITGRVDLGASGVFEAFAWEPGGDDVGWMADVATRPGVHAHWLFHHRVASLDAAIATVRAAGGLALEPVTLPGGDRFAACDDPQGAAFALVEAHAPPPR
jgi:hypothetical protein